MTVLALVVGGTAAFAAAQTTVPGGILPGSAASTAGAPVELALRDSLAAASRAADVDRAPLDAVRTVHVTVDGATQQLSTAAPTVRDALLEAGVVLGPHDRLSVPLDAEAVDGLAVLVTRVVPQVRTETTALPFETVREEDPDLLEGREVVVTPGRDGVRTIAYEALLVDGVEIERRVLVETAVSDPVTEVVRVGTRPPPPPVPASAPVDPGTSRAIGREMVLARGWGEDQWSCLDALWTKESNWRVTADNPSSSAYGIPQALPGSKMASAGADWQTNPATQITWGLGYISARYGTPCGAWAHSRAHNWY